MTAGGTHAFPGIEPTKPMHFHVAGVTFCERCQIELAWFGATWWEAVCVDD